MNGEALGVIETIGMAAAIEAADSCVKSANVTLIGYELTRGSGLVTIKIEGNVGAVKAAISAAKVSAGRVNKVYATLIIPRPAKDLDNIIKSKETVGLEKTDDKIKDESIVSHEKLEDSETRNSDLEEPELKEKNRDEQEEINSSDEEIEEDKSFDAVEETVPEEKHVIKVEDMDPSEEKTEDNKEVCNICHDPQCPRRKGQPRNLCIHYKKAWEGDRE